MAAALIVLRKRLTFISFLLLGLLTLVSTPSFAEPKFPALTGPVVDNAGLLSEPQEAEISAKIRSLRSQTSIQINVVTLRSLQGYDIREFGYLLGRHWGIGQKGKDNGVLLIVAPIERKVAIEVGYGLEPVLTDALSKLLIENKIIPHFKRGDFPAGIKAGVNDIAVIVSQDENAEALKEEYSAPQDEPLSPMTVFILIVVLLIILNNMNGGGGGLILGGPVSGGRRSSGGWSGGSSGGGAWSGGGGSFGGGGASGGW